MIASRKNRVVITGMGILAPNGSDLESFWSNLLRGVSGIGEITLFDPEGLPCRIAGEVKDFEPEQFIDPSFKPRKRMARSAQFAVAATHMALMDAGFGRAGLRRFPFVPVVVGVSTSAMDLIDRPPMPWTPVATCPHAVTSAIAYQFDMQARIYTISDGCTSGMDALTVAAQQIRAGVADVAIAGAADSAITRYTFECFAKSRKVSLRNDVPHKASRPFDRDRDGGIVAEGAGIVVLENLEHAIARGVRPYAEVLGWGVSADPHSPLEGGGMLLAMRQALANANRQPHHIDYINAHAPSDMHMDALEARTIHEVFGSLAARIPVSSIKGATGNPMAASSISQVVAAARVLREHVVFPTTNLEHPDPDCPLEHVMGRPFATEVNTVLVNSHGFGRGNNAIVLEGVPT